jgi:hypothetical protein
LRIWEYEENMNGKEEQRRKIRVKMMNRERG